MTPRSPSADPAPAGSTPSTRRAALGRIGLGGVALSLLAVVVTALVTIGAQRVMPHEAAWLEADLQQLDALHHDASLLGFVVHNRVAFVGALLAASLLYLWLLRGPLRRGEAWAWWTFAASAGPGTASYLSFVTTGYADPVHGLGSLGIAALLAIGLWGTWPSIIPPRGPRAVLAAAWPEGWSTWSGRSRLGWLLLAAWAGATIGGGLLVIATGMFPVFVPQDLAYLQATEEALSHMNPRLVPFLSHDRAGFGGGLIAAGLAELGVVLVAARPGASAAGGARRILALAWAIGFATAVLIHPVVGYDSLSHLAPFLAKDAAGLAGLVLLAMARERT